MSVNEGRREPQALTVEKMDQADIIKKSNDPQPEQAMPPKVWKIDDEQILPKNNLPLVFFSLLLALFLAALDQTIVATALPTIVAQLHGGQNYSWVGSAYLLASSASSPFYGKVSDLIGRKAVLYPVIIIFLLGSALCGAAQNMTWLIIARAIQGLGGGGIFQMVNITIGDIVPLEKRGTFGGYAGALWGIAAIIGPLVGGAFTDHVTWRWCFWVNLPTGGIALVFLFFSLHLNPVKHGKTFRQHIAEFDFLGLLLILGGVVCVLLGFNQSENSWRSPATISLLVVGFVVLVLAGAWETYTSRSPIIPPRLFRTRTTGIILITVFLHGFAFFSGSFYLPVYFQVLGASATKAGIQMLPYSLGSCVVSIFAGFLVTAVGDTRQIMWVSYIVMCIGYGLMILLDEGSSVVMQVLWPLLAGLGVGGVFYPPLLALQAAMPARDMATSTATLGLLRQIGSTVGVSIGQAVWTSELRQHIAHIPGFESDTSSANLADSIRLINHLQPLSLRRQVQHGYTKAISAIWIVDTPLIGLCVIMVFFLKKYSMKKKFVQADDQEACAAAGSVDPSPSPTVEEPEKATQKEDPDTYNAPSLTIRDPPAQQV